jgi:hypothetical protein
LPPFLTALSTAAPAARYPERAEPCAGLSTTTQPEKGITMKQLFAILVAAAFSAMSYSAVAQDKAEKQKTEKKAEKKSAKKVSKKAAKKSEMDKK